ncbi:type II toxin-antitoxin system HicA family toxin [bacterium]|nr:type II toxin-antitoxin system HicA family toxin [bacterium]MBU4510303.1 type II toxin-antitoxin system HicA family toxin [bacterium]
MHKLPIIKGKEFVRFLQSLGFKIVRTKGSHVRLRTEDQKRVTTIPIHKNKDIPKGLLRTIIREDLEISLEEFCKLYSKYKEKK